MTCCGSVTREVKLNQAKCMLGTGGGFLVLDDTNAHPHMKISRLASCIRSLVRTAATVLIEEFNNPNILVL